MKPMTLITFFKIKPGRLDQFIQAQREFASALKTVGHTGLLGGRMYKGEDGQSAVLVSQFESKAAQEALRDRDMFKAHVDALQIDLDSVTRVWVEEAYTS